MRNMNFKRKLPVPKEIKERYPLTAALAAAGVLGAAVLLLFACKKPRDQKGETC